MIARSVLAASLVMLSVAGAQAAEPNRAQLLRGTWHIVVNGNQVATVTMSPNGVVKGVQPNGDKDTGKWRISPNDRYCVTFSKWLDRTEHCSDVSVDSKGVVHGSGFSAHR